MRHLTLATDYDGTIATHGTVSAATLAALERVHSSGRSLVLVTGRELESLERTFDRLDLFDAVVAENGALAYYPAERREQVLCEPAPAALVLALREANVHPLSVGRTVLATLEPHQGVVLETIRRLGLEHHVIFNKGAVMVLPSGVNKASGLTAVLATIGRTAETTVAIGDAENDHAMLELAGFGAAVANALPALKRHADYVCERPAGEGVADLIDLLVKTDLEGLPKRRTAVPPVRHLGDAVDVTPEA